MRFSKSPKLAVVERKAQSNETFFGEVVRRTTAEERVGGILLVGANDVVGLTVRAAQAAIRWDRQASFWSHAAIILDWGRSAANAIGAEVTPDPVNSVLQVPERNGVTLFPLSRYFDTRRYPNLCFATFAFRKQEDHPAADRDPPPPAQQIVDRSKIVSAALTPNRERPRYPFWDWLGLWKRYIHTPAVVANPIVEGLPVPSAALCEYAYEAAGLDLTPGATAPNSCPESIWTTLLYWHTRVGRAATEVKAWRVVRDPWAQGRKSLSAKIPMKLD